MDIQQVAKKGWEQHERGDTLDLGPEWERVGGVCVDTGQILIVDPCHVHQQSEEPLMLDGSGEIAKQIQWTGAAKAVVSYSGIGDGYYPVYVRRTDGGSRVAELRVVFISEDGAHQGWASRDEMDEYDGPVT